MAYINGPYYNMKGQYVVPNKLTALKEAANRLHAKYVELVAGPNAHFLVSRNKREGKFLLNERKHYNKTRFGSLAKVNFAELGIKLSTLEEALNGRS